MFNIMDGRNWVGILAATTLTLFSSSGVAQHVDFGVAQDGTPQKKLVVEGDADILSGVEPIVLQPVQAGPLAGLYAIEVPGWESLKADEPGKGLFQLATPHMVTLQRVSWQPGFQMFDTSLSPILTSDGGTYEFSQSPPGVFHEDLFHAMDPNDGFLQGSTVIGTFKLVDPSGTHAESDEFTLKLLIPAGAPTLSQWGMVILIGLTFSSGIWVLRLQAGMPVRS